MSHRSRKHTLAHPPLGDLLAAAAEAAVRRSLDRLVAKAGRQIAKDISGTARRLYLDWTGGGGEDGQAPRLPGDGRRGRRGRRGDGTGWPPADDGTTVGAPGDETPPPPDGDPPPDCGPSPYPGGGPGPDFLSVPLPGAANDPASRQIAAAAAEFARSTAEAGDPLLFDEET